MTINSCNYVLRLIETFYEAEKLESEPIKLNYQTFDIVSIIKEIISSINLILKYHELKIVLNSIKECKIFADKIQIKKAIENILSNSIKHAYKHSTIEVKVEVVKNNLFFEVKNNSPYIPNSVLNEIFNKYKTSKFQNHSIGSGLTFHLSKEIINAHYGVMIAKSFEDDINIFGFSIPIK